jgi:hypothetical protein
LRPKIVVGIYKIILKNKIANLEGKQAVFRSNL